MILNHGTMKGAPVLPSSTGAFIAGHGTNTIAKTALGDEGTKNFSVSNESLYESYWKVERKAEAAAAEAEPKTPLVPASPAPTHMDSTNKDEQAKNGLGGALKSGDGKDTDVDVDSPSPAPSTSTTTSSNKFDKYYHQNLVGKSN